MKTRLRLALAALGAACMTQVSAQEVTLKLHHFLPPTSFAQTLFIGPWCEKIAKESNNRMKCQIYPSMQLGGTPPQLYEQVRDGVADIVWTLPGYTAGRFPAVEVFELPFMMQDPEGTSKAVWDYVQQFASNEFKDVKPLAFHVHGDGVFHMVNKPVKTAADLKGLKLRAPTRQTNKFIALLGATPVSMPVPQVGDALSKGVIDGAVVPYEVVPAVKIQELVKYHSETDPAEAAFYTSVFIFAMNKAKYESLPPDLKKVIDANTGLEWSKQIGRAFDSTTEPAKKMAAAVGGVFDTLTPAEYDRWVKQTEGVNREWIGEVGAKGGNGQALLDDARALIRKNGG